MSRTILVFGVPRSGTTWVGRMMASACNAEYLHEPDNEKLWTHAFAGKKEINRYPVGSELCASSDYAALWRLSVLGHVSNWQRVPKRLRFLVEQEIGNKCGVVHVSFFRDAAGLHQHWFSATLMMLQLRAVRLQGLLLLRKNKQPETSANGGSSSVHRNAVKVIKSVHGVRSIPEIAAWCSSVSDNPISVLVLVRDPRSVLESMLTLRMGDALRMPSIRPGGFGLPLRNPEGPSEHTVTLAIQQLECLYRSILALPASVEKYLFVRQKFEDILSEPEARMTEIAERLGLTAEMDVGRLRRFIDDNNVSESRGFVIRRSLVDMKRKSVSAPDSLYSKLVSSRMGDLMRALGYH